MTEHAPTLHFTKDIFKLDTISSHYKPALVVEGGDSRIVFEDYDLSGETENFKN